MPEPRTKVSGTEALWIAQKMQAQPHHRSCATQDGRECNCFKSSYDLHILARSYLALKEMLENAWGDIYLFGLGEIAREQLLAHPTNEERSALERPE